MKRNFIYFVKKRDTSEMEREKIPLFRKSSLRRDRVRFVLNRMDIG